MPAPITPALLEHFHQVTAEYTVSRIGASGRVYRDGTALQWLLPAVPVGIFNTAFGVDPDEGQLDRVLGRFAATGMPPRIELLPHALTPLFARRLASRGLVALETRALMYAEASELVAKPDPSVELDVVDAHNFERFVRADIESGGNPEPGSASSFAWWLEQPGWQLFLARVDGQDAGVGILYHYEDTGYLASAATLPAYRNRGVQRTLIHARCCAAREAGARWITARATFGSTSQRNLQRMGLQIAAMSMIFG